MITNYIVFQLSNYKYNYNIFKTVINCNRLQLQTTITTSLIYISLNGSAYDNGWGKAEHSTLTVMVISRFSPYLLVCQLLSWQGTQYFEGILLDNINIAKITVLQAISQWHLKQEFQEQLCISIGTELCRAYQSIF